MPGPVTRALARISPRAVTIRIVAVLCSTPASRASSGDSSQKREAAVQRDVTASATCRPPCDVRSAGMSSTHAGSVDRETPPMDCPADFAGRLPDSPADGTSRWYRRLQRFVMRRQRPVLQARRRPEPRQAVVMHDERLVPGGRGISLGVSGGAVRRRFPRWKFRSVESCPAARVARPTTRAFWSRSTAVRQAARMHGCRGCVDRPATRSPIRGLRSCGGASTSAIFVGPREDAGIDPASTGRRSIGGQIGEASDVLVTRLGSGRRHRAVSRA